MLIERLIFYLYLIDLTHSIVSKVLPSVSIFEESPLSTIVVDLRPRFEKLNVDPERATLLQSQSSQPFEYSNGRIRLKSRLDREDYVRKRLCQGGNLVQCNFTLTLTVDLNEAPFNYILSQPISCHDINDITPKFSHSQSTIVMAENVPIGHRIPLEMATDFDSPSFAIESYRLETMNGEKPSQFGIIYDKISRELELIVEQELDRETKEKYSFQLLAIDGGKPSKIGVLQLNIEIRLFEIAFLFFQQREKAKQKFNFDEEEINKEQLSVDRC